MSNLRRGSEKMTEINKITGLAIIAHMLTLILTILTLSTILFSCVHPDFDISTTKNIITTNKKGGTR